jgi:hypothetical protein
MTSPDCQQIVVDAVANAAFLKSEPVCPHKGIGPLEGKANTPAGAVPFAVTTTYAAFPLACQLH